MGWLDVKTIKLKLGAIVEDNNKNETVEYKLFMCYGCEKVHVNQTLASTSSYQY